MMVNILVTGGAGNIASAMVNRLAQDSRNCVIVVDNLLTGSISKIPLHYKNVTFIKSDVNVWTDISPLFFIHKFDYVFHYAAVVGVKRTLEHPLLVLNDIKGIENVLSLSKNTNVKRVFYASSSEVYGEPVHLPQNETTTPLNSKLPYAIIKNIGEAYLKTYFKEYGLNYTIFRFFNTYGPNQSEDFVIPKFLKLALKHQPITIYGDGSQTRTFIHVDDNVDFCFRCFQEALFVNDVVNVGSDIEVSIIQLANTILEVTNSKSKLVFLPPLPEGDMTRRKPDISNMKKHMNDFISLNDGLRSLIKTYGYENW